MDHRIELIAVQQNIGSRYLAGFAELLLVPYKIIIKKQFIGEFIDHGSRGVQYNFPQLVEIAVAAHPSGELVPVRTAFWQVIDLMWEKMASLVALLKK